MISTAKSFKSFFKTIFTPELISSEEQPSPSLEPREFTENCFMDFVIIEEGAVHVLKEEEWRAIIFKKSLQGHPIRDIYKSLEVGIPFVMYFCQQTQRDLANPGRCEPSETTISCRFLDAHSHQEQVGTYHPAGYSPNVLG